MSSISKQYNFKSIQVVPTSKDFVDIILSKTQRKTPTVVRRGWKISRIRDFYMLKVKFTQANYTEKLTQILDDFPRLDELHPFYGSLINVLYSRDHYKLALAQINTARSLVDNIGKDYVRLLKYGDSLYRCKQLKRAALGRMCTLMKKLTASLSYLEEVRQHLSRLPSIDPNTRTLILTGFPNVGKSSFINKVSRANVDVQPYAFTTKSIFVGHFDYRYLRWQVIDTPGILDHALDERNTIEMQAVTALAHLNAAILYFVDVSEDCGYTIKQQVSLYHSIKPLFVNKPLILVANKTDLRKIKDLDSEDQALIESIVKDKKCPIIPMSNVSAEGINAVRTTACDQLLEHRVSRKTKKMGSRVEDVVNRIHVAHPQQRDTKKRPVSIPESVIASRFGSSMDTDTKITEKDIELKQGGPGVYNANLRKHWDLEVPEWRNDKIPEIIDGKNIADFIDPDIDAKLVALENEEVERQLLDEANSMRDDGFEDLDDDEKELVAMIRQEKQRRIAQNLATSNNAGLVLPRAAKARGKKASAVAKHLQDMGINPEKFRARSKSRPRQKRKRDEAEMDVDIDEKGRGRSKSKQRGSAAERAKSEHRELAGLRSVRQKREVEKAARKQQQKLNQDARGGPGDRRFYTKMPKHLLTGKRGIGKTDRR